MGYKNNREFLPLTNRVNLYSDGCGETYEKKYYVNGAYIDLCGMSVEEYMKNPCCNGGGSDSDNDNEDVKPQNVIRVISYEENGFYYYKAIANYPVASNIKVNVSNYENEIITMLDIYVGDSESNAEIGEALEIKDVTLNIEEDEEFKYIPSIGNVPDEPSEISFKVYAEALHVSNIENMTAEDIKMLPSYDIQEVDAIDVKFVIPATDVDTGDMEEDELMEFCKANQYGFILVLPKHIYDNKAYTLFNYGGNEVNNKFQYWGNYVIDSDEFVCIIEKAIDDIMPYVPLFNEDLMYEYKLTIKK